MHRAFAAGSRRRDFRPGSSRRFGELPIQHGSTEARRHLTVGSSASLPAVSLVPAGNFNRHRSFHAEPRAAEGETAFRLASRRLGVSAPLRRMITLWRNSTLDPRHHQLVRQFDSCSSPLRSFASSCRRAVVPSRHCAIASSRRRGFVSSCGPCRRVVVSSRHRDDGPGVVRKTRSRWARADNPRHAHA